MSGAWIRAEDKFKFQSCETPLLQPGFYNAMQDYNGVFLQKAKVSFDEVHDVEDPVTVALIASTRKFFAAADKYKELGSVHKRGILLYGPPGTGKSSILNLLSQEIIGEGGVILFAKQNHIRAVETLIHQIRESNPDQLLGVVFEDIETYIDDHAHQKMMLGLLSGEAQIDGVLFMATTNLQLEQLPDTITKRPSRFDEVAEVGFPSVKSKYKFLTKFVKGKINDVILKKISESTEGLSIAHLKEIVISNYCLDVNLDACMKRVTAMKVVADPKLEDYELDEMEEKTGSTDDE